VSISSVSLSLSVAVEYTDRSESLPILALSQVNAFAAKSPLDDGCLEERDGSATPWYARGDFIIGLAVIVIYFFGDRC